MMNTCHVSYGHNSRQTLAMVLNVYILVQVFDKSLVELVFHSDRKREAYCVHTYQSNPDNSLTVDSNRVNQKGVHRERDIRVNCHKDSTD